MKSNVAVWNECCGIEVNVKVEDMEDCQNSEMKLIKEHLETSTPFIPIDRVIESLNVVNQWAEQSNINININDVVVIKKLLDKAIIQKIKNSRKQTKIPDYFNTK